MYLDYLQIWIEYLLDRADSTQAAPAAPASRGEN